MRAPAKYDFSIQDCKNSPVFSTVAPKEVFPGNTIQKETKRKIDGPGSDFVRILILSKRKKGIVKGETEMEKQM